MNPPKPSRKSIYLLAAYSTVDLRTATRYLSGESFSGVVGDRIEAALAAHPEILPPHRLAVAGRLRRCPPGENHTCDPAHGCFLSTRGGWLDGVCVTAPENFNHERCTPTKCQGRSDV